MTSTAPTASVLSADKMLNHWQGHRRLTRKLIEAFPEDKLFSFSIGGMRPFSELAMECVHLAAPVARGVATGKWANFDASQKAASKAELLALWDRDTVDIDATWPTIPAHRFSEVDKAFGQWENTGIGSILYAIDNEIHHRGQGYVYLRALGIEPPAFYDRG